MRLRSKLALIAVFVVPVCGPVGGADASHVACTQILTQDTTLDSDVNCPGAVFQGLRFGAPNITLDMNGFTLSSPPDTNALTGIGNAGGYDGVRVLNGRVRGFHYGVYMVNGAGVQVSDMSFELNWHFEPNGVPTAVRLVNAPDSTIADVTTGPASVTGGAHLVVATDSDRTSVARGTCTDDRPFATPEIFVTGSAVRVEDSHGCEILAGAGDAVVTRNATRGINVSGARAQVIDNTGGSIRATGVDQGRIADNSGVGMQLENTRDAVVESNVLTGLVEFNSSDRNEFRGNRVTVSSRAAARMCGPDRDVRRRASVDFDRKPRDGERARGLRRRDPNDRQLARHDRFRQRHFRKRP